MQRVGNILKRNNVARSRNLRCQGKATIRYLCIVDVYMSLPTS